MFAQQEMNNSLHIKHSPRFSLSQERREKSHTFVDGAAGD